MKKNKKYILDLYLSKSLCFKDLNKTLKWLNSRYGDISLKPCGENSFMVERLNLGTLGFIRPIKKD